MTAHKLLHTIEAMTVVYSYVTVSRINATAIIIATTAVDKVAVRLSISSMRTSVASAIGIAYKLNLVAVAMDAINVITTRIIVKWKSLVFVPLGCVNL